MKLEGIMLSEISSAEKDTSCVISQVEPEKKKLNREPNGVARGWVVVEMGRRCSKGTNFDL